MSEDSVEYVYVPLNELESLLQAQLQRAEAERREAAEREAAHGCCCCDESMDEVIPQPRLLRSIIRRIDGAVDDVVIDGDLLRMEQMDRDSWWVCIYRGEQRVSFLLRWDTKSREIVAFVADDELGCVDDSFAES